MGSSFGSVFTTFSGDDLDFVGDSGSFFTSTSFFTSSFFPSLDFEGEWSRCLLLLEELLCLSDLELSPSLCELLLLCLSEELCLELELELPSLCLLLLLLEPSLCLLLEELWCLLLELELLWPLLLLLCLLLDELWCLLLELLPSLCLLLLLELPSRCLLLELELPSLCLLEELELLCSLCLLLELELDPCLLLDELCLLELELWPSLCLLELDECPSLLLELELCDEECLECLESPWCFELDSFFFSGKPLGRSAWPFCSAWWTLFTMASPSPTFFILAFISSTTNYNERCTSLLVLKYTTVRHKIIIQLQYNMCHRSLGGLNLCLWSAEHEVAAKSMWQTDGHTEER